MSLPLWMRSPFVSPIQGQSGTTRRGSVSSSEGGRPSAAVEIASADRKIAVGTKQEKGVAQNRCPVVAILSYPSAYYRLDSERIRIGERPADWRRIIIRKIGRGQGFFMSSLQFPSDSTGSASMPKLP